MTQIVNSLPTMQETQVQSSGWEDLLEKEMATHASIVAWKTPRREEPGRLQKIVPFILLAGSRLPFLLPASMKQTAMLEKATWQGIEGGLWPTVLEELNPWAILKVDPSLVEPWDDQGQCKLSGRWLQPVRDSKWRTSCAVSRFLIRINSGRINMCCLSL